MSSERKRASARRPSTLMMALAGLLASTMQSCDQGPGQAVVTPPDQVLQECPMDGHHALVPDTLVLAGSLSKVPEFHDCQRFISRKTQEYESLYAIWVRESLDVVVYPTGLGGGIPGNADSVGNRLAAGTPYVIGDSTFTASGEPTEAVGVPVAIVWSDKLPYPDLGIEPGYNCLYMYDPPAWKAKMVPVGDQKDCSPDVNVNPTQVTGTNLAVRRSMVAGLNNGDYPPVARWDADSAGRYFIGIKCLAAWCEVGNEILKSPGYSGDRTRTVPGWYDEQYLAVSTTIHPHWPSRILGTMFPDPLLDGYMRTGFPVGTFVTVAWTALSQGPGKGPPDPTHLGVYKTKFNFDPAPVTGAMNRIELCRGPRDTCIPAGIANPPTCPAAASDTLWARISSGATGAVAYRCVTYTDHGVDMPGVVRWRWLANDEKGWVPCPSGCCQVNQ